MGEKNINFRPKKEVVGRLKFLGFINKKDGTNKHQKNLSNFINRVLIEKLQFDEGDDYDLIINYLKWELVQEQTEMDKFCEEKTKIMSAIAKEIEELKLKQKKEEEKNDSKTIRG